MARLTRHSKAMQAERPPRAETTGGWGAHPLHAWWRVSPGRLAFFLDQLGELLNAGVNMYDAALQLAAHTPDGRLRRMSGEIAQGASQGQSLAAQLARYPQLVPPHVRGMILAAERAGTLPAALRELADELRSQQYARWKLLAASLWFALIFTVAFFIVPMAKMALVSAAEHIDSYQSSETPVQYVLRVTLPVISHWLKHVFLPAAVGTLAVVLITKLVAGLPRLQRPVKQVVHRLPIIGNLVRRAATTRFLVSLHALLQAGVEIQEALGIAAEATGDVLMTDQLQAAGARIRSGQNLTQALRPCTCLPREAKDSLTLAETAGTYDRALSALITGSRQARQRTVTMSAMFGYSFTLITSAVVVAIVVYSFFVTYVDTVLHVWDD